ncbi:interferon a3-like [Gouania willdenowi]|uniref:interferon a3-like n=1 Tax=Gouania willdenowi TaxID=441366 RepID=UPI00105437DC|nr:interferon a3-like [Gouania willdenowi]
MMMKKLFACVILCALCVSSGFTLRCPWIDQKFKQYSEETVKLLDNMVKNSTNTSIELDLAFPHHMYERASKAPAEEKLGFLVQVLNEVFALFEEDHTDAHWDEKKVNDFLNVLSRQAAELNACVTARSHMKHKNLHHYFQRLSSNVLELKNHSSEAWEITRKEVKVHLLNVDLVASALVPII